MRKLLIVTADDFALHESIDEGILAAAKRGIVSSVSVVPNAVGFDGAVRRLREQSHVSVGAHLNLTDGPPVTTAAGLGGLVRPSTGLFLGAHQRVAAQVLLGRAPLTAVRAEYAAQIERLAAAGFEVTHLNTHGHLHLLPPLYRIVEELAVRFGVPFVRFPVERPLLSDALRRRGPVVVGSWLAGIYLRPTVSRGVVGRTDHFRGLRQSGRLDVRRLRALVRHLPEGTTELMVHPGRDSQDLRRSFRWPHQWSAEQAALCDEGVRRELEAQGVRVVGFDDGRLRRPRARNGDFG